MADEETKWKRMHSKKTCVVCGEEAFSLRDAGWLCPDHVDAPGGDTLGGLRLEP